MGTIFLVILSVIVGIYLGALLGVYIAFNWMQDGFNDAINQATSMFFNSVDKIKESYEILYADFKKSSGLPSSTDKEGK